MTKKSPEEMEIPLQIGSELRITENGITVSNPELELAWSQESADAVLAYRFDETTGDHVLRLLEPLAIKKYRAVHTHQGPHERPGTPEGP